MHEIVSLYLNSISHNNHSNVHTVYTVYLITTTTIVILQDYQHSQYL